MCSCRAFYEMFSFHLFIFRRKCGVPQDPNIFKNTQTQIKKQKKHTLKARQGFIMLEPAFMYCVDRVNQRFCFVSLNFVSRFSGYVPSSLRIPEYSLASTQYKSSLPILVTMSKYPILAEYFGPNNCCMASSIAF